jgi:hypothetical protein
MTQPRLSLEAVNYAFFALPDRQCGALTECLVSGLPVGDTVLGRGGLAHADELFNSDWLCSSTATACADLCNKTL